MKVLLADDHALVRKGIRAVLTSLPGVEVVAETSDGREALSLIESMKPDVAVLDITMPGLNGLEVAIRTHAVSSRTKILILSMHAGEAYVAQALRAGVAGYLLKDAADDELPMAIKAVSRGDVYLSPKISRQLVDRYVESGSAQPDPLAGLTTRQREILQLVAEGKSSKEIAVLLDLSVKTVESHRGQIMERLGVHDLTGLVRFAIRVGLVSPES
ncbi:MAG TPA: response regulator transcription factor [Candidatus Sulfotelmatobacter sp.]|jgi:DNA-binding NarL/FixJ family response regulator|nr:response regulator transcription factor [Candidatus Sulfotelmatobacter sp.]